MIRVEFDDQVFQSQRRGGVTRYFTELIHQLRAAPELGIEVSTPFRHVLNEHLVQDDPERYRRSAHRRLARLLDAPLRARRVPADLLHTTYYDPGAFPESGPPLVSTVHDMLPELRPEAFPDGNPHRLKRDYVMRSAVVLCVSATTRDDLLRCYGDPPGAVVVVPHGVGDEFRASVTPSVALPPRYVLFVGRRGGYKRWLDVVAAMGSSPDLDDVAFVSVGGGAFDDSERAALREHGLDGRAHQLTVSDRDLPGVYARADAFVYPSLYEGFGLPLLEAFAAGTAVVAADIPVFREVSDGAARLVAPGDVDGLAASLAEVVGDRTTRASLVDAGRLRASEFTWRRTAELTAAAYTAALRSGRR